MRALFASWIIVSGFSLASPAWAQDRLAQAEEAYLEVDFPRARELAQQALSEGGHEPGDVARMYRLMGIAAAADGDEEAARDAFARMIALGSPEDGADLSPRLRQPLLEARGEWAARNGAFEVDARRLRQSRGVGLQLQDPLGMAARVVAFVRVRGAAAFERVELEAQDELAVPVTGLTAEAAVEYHVEVLDQHGNHLLELGSEIDPESFEGQAAVADVVAPSRPSARGEWRLAPVWLTVPAGLTLVSAALLTWSTVDVLESHDAYLASPTLDGYYAGLDLQTRTNVLIVTTSVLGAASVAWALLLTDWSGGEAADAVAFVVPTLAPGEVGLVSGGRF